MKRIAIIGFGPRGLGALEALLPRGGTDVFVEIFDPVAFPAAGPNFAPDESGDCLLNLPVRAVQLPPSPVTDFPRFGQGHDSAGDVYLPRAELGRYLVSRQAALQRRFGERFNIRAESIVRAERTASGWQLFTADADHGPFDHIVLCQGQPETAPDPQIVAWSQHAEIYGLTLLPAYPTAPLRRGAKSWAGTSVAIRGLGLSTLDVLAMLTLGLGGRLEEGVYHSSGREPAHIYPFSLDGMPPAPKPVDREEARYALMPEEEAALRCALADAMRLGPEAALEHICRALEAPARRVSGADAADWLATEREAPGTQRGDDPVAALDEGIAMATGGMAPDVGYAIGQLWRKWQPTLREVFNFSEGEAETRLAILGFDNGLKRYSYGPPLRSSVLLRALVRCGLVTLSVADDPDIRPVPEGWQFDGGATAQVMIDAVLPAPSLARITDPLIRSLVAEGHLTALAKDGGISVTSAGRVRRADGTVAANLSVLGRLTEGSVIAADSIHDCFGVMTQSWASSVV